MSYPFIPRREVCLSQLEVCLLESDHGSHGKHKDLKLLADTGQPLPIRAIGVICGSMALALPSGMNGNFLSGEERQTR